jgi:molecular chaperone DnaK
MSRAQLDRICEALVKRTVAPFEACMRDAKMGSGDIGELVLVGGMTRNPQVVETAKKLTGKTPHQGVNPDEVVAIGAAIQGGVLQGDVGDILLLDVTPLTLGIETAGGISTPMIERNTTIPTKKMQVFTTYADGQTGVDIHITQGERPMVCDNKSLGNFRLEGIPMAPRGVPQIEVTFDIDANGILHVSAKDRGSGKEQKITITSESGLSDAEIERLKREAEEHAAEDRERRERVEARNQLDSTAYQVGKQLEELKEKFSEEDQKAIQGALDGAKAVLAREDAETGDMNRAREELSKAIQGASAKMYSQFRPDAQQQQQAGGDGGAGPSTHGEKKEKVVDADFEVVDGK